MQKMPRDHLKRLCLNATAWAEGIWIWLYRVAQVMAHVHTPDK